MADQDILAHIHELVEEEHRLRNDETAPDSERLRHLEEQLDQAWDLLRQRRAKREYGEPESDAQERSTETVERYQS